MEALSLLTCHCDKRLAFVAAAMALLSLQPSLAATPSFDVKEFGAKGDGRTKDTQAIQAAINKASSSGGAVTLSPGKYLSGTIHLRSNVTVHLERGATILFSPDDNDFDAYEKLPYHLSHSLSSSPVHSGDQSPVQIRKNAAPPAWDDTETSYAHYALLSGDGVTNVTIEGDGEIDGNRPKRGGPKPIAFRNSQWISIRGITIRDAPNYNISLMGSDFIEVDRVKLINGYADGIDPDNCHFVRITNSYVDVFDDAICPKASMALGKPRGTEHLVVANCILRTNCNNFKFGTETEGNLKNVSVTNCVMLRRDQGRPALAGIALESVDGGNVDGVVISNIEMEEPLAPIFIRIGSRARGMEKPAPGTLEDISIQNVIAHNATLASSITGIDNARVQNVTIDGLDVTTSGTGVARDLNVPELETKYPDSNMFGDLPASVLYVRHATGVVLSNLRVHTNVSNVEPALVFDNVVDANISGFSATNESPNNPLLLFRNVAGALVSGTRLSSPTSVFLRLSGEKTRDIALRANDLYLAKKRVEQSDEVARDVVSTDQERALSH